MEIMSRIIVGGLLLNNKQTIREEIILSNIMEKHKLYLNGQTN